MIVRGARQVHQDKLPGARKTSAETATSMGAGESMAKAQVGGALAQFGGVAGAVIEREIERADNVALLKAKNQVDAWRSNRLFNNETGALKLKGEQALGLPETVDAEYEAFTAQVEAGLSTPRQRQAFAEVKASRGNELKLTLMRHVMGEMDKFEEQELTSAIKNNVSFAIANAQDPKAVGTALDEAIAAVKKHGTNLGWGKETVKQKVLEVSTVTHVGVIETLLSLDKDKAAKVYYEETESQISGESRKRINDALEEGTVRGEARRTADEIIGKGGTLTEQRAAAKNIEDTKVRAAVESHLEHEAQVVDRAKRQKIEDDSNSAYDILDKTPNVSRIPPALWTSLPGPVRSSLKAYAEDKVRGVPTKTNQGVWAELMLTAAQNPEKFITGNLLEHRADLSDSDFQQLTQIKASLISGNREAAQKTGLGDFETNKQVVDRTLEQFGIPTSGKEQTPANKAAAAQLYRLVADEMKAEAERTKKAPDQAFVQSVADRIISTEVVMNRTFWNQNPANKRLIEMTIQDVTPEERKQIEGFLAKSGKPINDQVVLDLYIRARLPRKAGK